MCKNRKEADRRIAARLFLIDISFFILSQSGQKIIKTSSDEKYTNHIV